MNRTLAWMLALGAAVPALLVLRWALPPWEVWRAQALAVTPRLWLGVVLFLAGSYLVRAGRIRAEWSGRHAAGLGECLRLTLVHSAAVNLLPMRTGEAGYPAWLALRWGVSVADAGLSLLWMRLQDMVVLAAWGFVAFGPGPLSLRAALALSVVVGLAAVMPAIGRVWTRRLARASVAATAWRSRLARAIQRGAQVGWLFSAAHWTLKLVALGLLLSAAASVAPEEGWAGAVGGEVAAALPIQAPAGLGTYEAGVWTGVHLARGEAAEEDQSRAVVGAALLMHALVLVLSCGGGAVALAQTRCAGQRLARTT